MENKYRDIEIEIIRLIDKILYSEIEIRNLPYGRALVSSASSRIASNAVNQALREALKMDGAYKNKVVSSVYYLMSSEEREKVISKIEDRMEFHFKSGYSYPIILTRVSQELAISKPIIQAVANISEKIILLREEYNKKLNDGRRVKA